MEDETFSDFFSPRKTAEAIAKGGFDDEEVAQLHALLPKNIRIVNVKGKEIQLYPTYPWCYFMVDQEELVRQVLQIAQHYGLAVKKKWVIDHGKEYWENKAHIAVLSDL